MTASTDTLLERLSRPEYTGENRCIPCTSVNVLIAAVLGAVVSRRSRRVVGALVFVGSLGLVYLRGYLVPGTPTLTKRYFPDWLLALFDKEPASVQHATLGPGPSRDGSPDASSRDPVGGAAADPTSDDGQSRDAAFTGGERVDPEEVLSRGDVVEPCDDEDDLCLTDDFAAAWRAECPRLRDETTRLDALSTLLDRESVSVSTTPTSGQVTVTAADGERLAAWPSEGAMVADVAAHRVLSSRTDVWASVAPEGQFGILAGLRSFLDTCPLCDGPIDVGQSTVESCCRSWDVLSVRCTECDSRLLELDPETLETVA